MTTPKQHFTTIAQLAQFMGQPAPEHPMVYVWRIAAYDTHSGYACAKPGTTFSSDCYTIAVKKILSGEMHYGRTKYDFTNGSMVFTAPRQEITCTNLVVAADAVMIAIHEDFLLGSQLRETIRRYGFFSYAVNEALHLSPREEDIVRTLMEAIHGEYRSNPDEFSKDLILSQIATMLKYADRYYKRQFLNRAATPGNVVSRFDDAIRGYFAAGQLHSHGLPRIDTIAGQLGVSGRYLSDALKAETGKSAMDHIHLYLLDEAKNLLLRPDLTISEVSSRLGFDYPQYFSRLFKKKIGVSPKSFRDHNGLH